MNKGIDRFLNKHGQLAQIPVRHYRRIEILGHLAGGFASGEKLNEGQVNAELMRWHDDYVMLRRMLVDYKFLARSSDGKTYWRSGIEK